MFNISTNNLRPIIILSFFHIFILALSNYLTQIPLIIHGHAIVWGTLTFPFIFLITDLTVRLFGAPLARKIVFLSMLPAFLLTYFVSVTFVDAKWVGLGALLEVNTFVLRIALACFFAYLIGQLLDILVFNKLRKNKKWWVAPAASNIIGNAMDSFVFSVIAFYKCSDPFMAEHWVSIALLDYCFKVLCGTVFLVPLYGLLLNFLQKIFVSKESLSYNTY